jgi:hypothetical protein
MMYLLQIVPLVEHVATLNMQLPDEHIEWSVIKWNIQRLNIHVVPRFEGLQATQPNLQPTKL